MIVRQFISWIRTAPAGERAEATRSLARAWLISDLSEDDRAAAEGALLMLLDDTSPLVRQAMAEVFARSAEAPAAIVQALSLDQASVALAGARTFTAADRRRPRRHRRDRQLRDAMRDRPPHQSAGLGLRRDRRSRQRRRSARADRKRLCRAGAVLLGPHRRAPRPSRRDPGIDAGAGRSAGRDAGWRWSPNSPTRWRSSSSPATGSAPTGQGGSPARRATAPPSTSRRVRAATTWPAWCGICAPPASSPQA